MTTSRLSNIVSHLVSSDSSDNRSKWASLPTFDELPNFKEFTGCAWDVWGAGDQLGTINLLTEDVVKSAAKEVK